jgi:hypothetical protein
MTDVDATEDSTQSPNNVGQAILTSYLSPEHWGISGFMRWMWGKSSQTYFPRIR